jgi:hypothetical protein
MHTQHLCQPKQTDVQAWGRVSLGVACGVSMCKCLVCVLAEHTAPQAQRVVPLICVAAYRALQPLVLVLALWRGCSGDVGYQVLAGLWAAEI